MFIIRSTPPPPLHELALVTMSLVTTDGETCCASQLCTVMEQFNLRAFHKRSIYVPIYNLCSGGYIKVSHVDTIEQSMLDKKGRRKHYMLTRPGREAAETLYEQRKDYYDTKVPLPYWKFSPCLD